MVFGSELKYWVHIAYCLAVRKKVFYFQELKLIIFVTLLLQKEGFYSPHVSPWLRQCYPAKTPM
jgi:hypothetical protein